MDAGTILMYVVSYFGLFTAMFFLVTLIERRREIESPTVKSYPTVTIGIPAYNEEDTIEGTVNSLLNLNYPKDKYEIVVINDGSRDNTLRVAKTFEKCGVRVIDKPNSGKADSLNTAIKESQSDLFASLDADSYAHPEALKRMVGHFDNPNVMAVTPSLLVHEPQKFLQKVQKMEFLLGVFLRKAFAFLGSIHVTPGPLSVYRKSFFEKYGYYDTNNQTEDIEVALRIQKLGYEIHNAVRAYVTTQTFDKFRPLLKQRVRWYSGFIQNTLKYKGLFSRKHGNLGLFVLPSAFISVALMTMVMAYTAFKIIYKDIIENVINLYAVNFEFWELFHPRFDLFYFNSQSIAFISFATLFLGIIVIFTAKKLANMKRGILLHYVFFMAVYWFLFSFWWIVSFFSVFMKRKIGWGEKKYG